MHPARTWPLVVALVGALPAGAQKRQPLRPPLNPPPIVSVPLASDEPVLMPPPSQRAPLRTDRIRERPGRPWLIAGGIIFCAGYAAMLGWGGVGIYQTLQPDPLSSPGERGMWALVIGMTAPIPVVFPFWIGLRAAELHDSPSAAFFLTAGTLQAVGAVVATIGLLIPDRWVKLRAGTVPVSRNVRWQLLPGAPGTPLGATLALDFPP